MAKSGKPGGALLERALARASNQTETSFDQEGERPILASGIATIAAENRTPTTYDWVPEATAGATGGFDLEIDRRDVSIDLHELIAETMSEVSRVHAEQTTLHNALLAANETIRTQGEAVENLRLAIEANTSNNGTRDAERAELRRSATKIRALSDRRGEQIAELREKIHSMRSLEKENESLRRELLASDSLRRDAAGELSALRNEFDESKRELLQRSEEYSTLRDQFADAERLAAKRDARIEQLLRSLERNETGIAERDLELGSLRDALSESNRSGMQSIEEIEQLRRARDRDQETARARSGELQALRDAVAESERSARASADELETSRRFRARAEDDLQRRDGEVASLREAQIENERVNHQRGEETERLTHDLALRTDEVARLRGTIASNEAIYQASLDEQSKRTEAAEKRIATQTEANNALQQKHLELEQHNEHQLAEIRTRTEQAEREISERSKGEEANNAELEQLRKKAAGHDELTRESDRQLALLRRELQSHKNHVAERDIEMVDLRQSLADLSEHALEDDREKAFLDTRVEELETALASTREEADALSESLESAYRTSRVEEEQARRYREGLATAEQVLADRERELSELRASLASAKRAPSSVETGVREQPRGLDPASENTLLRERLEPRDSEIETLQHVIASAEERNTALRGELSELRSSDPRPLAIQEPECPVVSSAGLPDAQDAGNADSAGEVQPESAGTPAAALLHEPPVVGREDDAAPSDGSQAGWKLFPWRRRREVELQPPAPVVATAAPKEEIVVVPAVTGPPTFDAPQDPGLPVSDRQDRPAIFHYWKRTQIASKLDRPQIVSVDDFFLSYLLDLCKRNPQRANRIVSIGTGSHDLEVVLARRALDAGVKNFNIHCLAEVSSTLHTERAIAAERTILANLTLLQCKMETWPIENPYSLVIVNDSLHKLANPNLWIDRIVASLEPGARVLVHSPIVAENGASSQVAKEIAHEIWRLMPERYKAHEHGGLEMPYSTVSPNADDEPTPDAPNILKLLADRLGFEVFVAFGNVINAFVDETVGMNFDPENERDRRFIDQVATVDDGKIDSGLIPPTHMLAALAVEPQDARIYKHWTPEFCLGQS